VVICGGAVVVVGGGAAVLVVVDGDASVVVVVMPATNVVDVAEDAFGTEAVGVWVVTTTVVLGDSIAAVVVAGASADTSTIGEGRLVT
jgi:hypothetical protein